MEIQTIPFALKRGTPFSLTVMGPATLGKVVVFPIKGCGQGLY
jgi:hypothetical protein